MNRWILNAIGVSILAALGLSVWGGFGLTRIAYTMLEKSANTAQEGKRPIDGLTATLAALNAPCRDFQGDYICGPIPQLAQTEKNIGILAARSAQQVQQTATLVTATAANLNTVGDSVKQLAGSLSGTATAATGTLTAATGTFGALTVDAQAVKPSLDAFPPLIASYTAVGDNVNGFIKENSPVVHRIAVHVAGMSASGDLMLSDAQWKEHQLLHPDKVKLGFWSATDATFLWLHSRVIPPIL
jgi:hypothetical protein